MRIHPQGRWLRPSAAAMLGALLFLVVASFLVLPCLNASTTGLFSSVAGPQACQEQKMFKAQADLVAVKFAPAEAVFRFLVALPVVAAFALAWTMAKATRAWVPPPGRFRIGTLPFATSDPPKLPAFAALRDA